MVLSVLALIGCSAGAKPSAAPPRPSPTIAASPSTTPAATPVPTPTALKAPGPFHYNQRVVAQNLVAPWAMDFAQDGSIWLTERPGRVRVVRNGQLLPDPALSLPVVTQNGCEDGLLGLAIKDPYVFLVYTYAGSAGNTNRVSRFTMQGDHLASEQVLLDGIPGGACYHFGGRIKVGPDGWLYVTTGEGFVASRAADRTSLSGKILRLHQDGSGQEIFAWGFRNPQGLAFDPQGRLYASNHGPTGDLGLCCHDEVDLVQQGAFYGWPAWAANTRTSYPGGSLPERTAPVTESGTDTWAPSGIAFYAPAKDEQPTLMVTELKGQVLRRLIIDPNQPDKVAAQEIVLQGNGRLRDAVSGPDGCLYLLTSNRDSRGSPAANDDHMYALCPQ